MQLLITLKPQTEAEARALAVALCFIAAELRNEKDSVSANICTDLALRCLKADSVTFTHWRTIRSLGVLLRGMGAGVVTVREGSLSSHIPFGPALDLDETRAAAKMIADQLEGR